MLRTRPASFFDHIVAWSFNRSLPKLVQYPFAAAIVAVVGIARIALIPDTLPWLLFIPAILAIALVMEKGAGLFSATLSTAFGIASLGRRINEAWLVRPQWIAASLFLLVTVALVMLVAELRASMRRAHALSGPNRSHHSRTASWQMSIPRSNIRPSTFPT